MEEKEILINNLKINYKIAGNGPVILILHGWGGSSDSWIKVQEILGNKNYKVIVPDLPGFGKSNTPSVPWGTKEYCDFILSLTEKLGLENFFLIGHSFGGQLAVRFAISYPEKVKKLVLCAPAAIRPKPRFKIKIIYWIAKFGNIIFSSKYLMRFKERIQNLFYLLLGQKDYLKANPIMKETLKKVTRENFLGELSKIKAKSLIIWGEKDKSIPVKYATIFKEEIINSELKILSKISHSPHLEIPEKLSEIISNFLKL